MNQIVLLPIITSVILLIFGFTAKTAVRIMIIAACPVGTASYIVTKLANWDVALSVILTALPIAIKTGVQKMALALAIAGLLVAHGPTFNAHAIPAALYSVI